MGSVDTAGIYFRGGGFFSSSHCGEASLLSDSPLSDTYVGTLAEKKPMNSPLAAGALPQDWKHQYFEIGWKQASLGSAAAALRGCAAVFCLPLCSSQGQLSPINVFSVLWGIAECGRTTANETKSCDFFFKRGTEPLPDCVRCHVQFSRRCADQVVPRLQRGGTVSEESWSAWHHQSCPSLFPPSNWAEHWMERKCWRIALTRVGGDADEKGRGSEGSLGH